MDAERKSQEDVTPGAYAAHKKGNSAPPPMSAREVELAGIRDAEKERTEGMTSRKSHVGATAHGLNWSPEVEKAVAGLFSGSPETLVVLVSVLTSMVSFSDPFCWQGIDTATETLILSGVHEAGIQAIPATLPANDPSKRKPIVNADTHLTYPCRLCLLPNRKCTRDATYWCDPSTTL
jgi:twinfilin